MGQLGLMLFDVVPYDNIYAIKNYSKLICGLTAIGDLKAACIFMERPEKIYGDYPNDMEIIRLYAGALVYMSARKGLPEGKEIIKKLEELCGVNAGLETEYGMGLPNLSCRQPLPEAEESVNP